jgi:hypothetical protein
LWLGSTAAVGACAGLFAVDVTELVEERIGVAVGATVTLVADHLSAIRFGSLIWFSGPSCLAPGASAGWRRSLPHG